MRPLLLRCTGSIQTRAARAVVQPTVGSCLQLHRHIQQLRLPPAPLPAGLQVGGPELAADVAVGNALLRAGQAAVAAGHTRVLCVG